MSSNYTAGEVSIRVLRRECIVVRSSEEERPTQGKGKKAIEIGNVYFYAAIDICLTNEMNNTADWEEVNDLDF